MFTILKGFTLLMVLGLLSLLLVKMFSVKILVGAFIAMVFLILCYLAGLIVEDILD